MEKIKARSVNLRGCINTLYPAAAQFEVDEDLTHILLGTSCKKLGIMCGDGQEKENILATDPDLPDTFTRQELSAWTDAYTAEQYVDAGLLVQEGDDTFTFSELMIKVLKQTKENLKAILAIEPPPRGCPYQ